MKRRIAPTDLAPPPRDLFSHGLVVGETIYISGQHAGGPDGAPLGDGSMHDQTRRSLAKIQRIVEAAGASMGDVVKLTIYVTDIAKRDEVNAARREYFSGDTPPCATLLQVSGFLHPDLSVEVDATAVIGADERVKSQSGGAK